MCVTFKCSICKHETVDPIREYRATEKIYSCPKCGAVLLKEPFILSSLVSIYGEVATNV